MNLIFDFDGTICDSLEITVNIINEYLTTHNKAPIDAKFLKEKGIEKLVKSYKLNSFQILVFIYLGRRRFASHIKELKSFEGLTSVLQKLSRTNHLGILSTNSKKNINLFLKLNKIDKYFEFVENTSNLFGKAKKLRKLKADFYIGDEIRDIEAAHNAKTKSVAVSWGFEGRALLKKANPNFLIDSPEELLLLGKQPQH